jgi:hypothetical protein
MSILGAGSEKVINVNDLDLKTTFSPSNCANHSIMMNDFMAEQFAAREPGITFIHSSPGVVNTGLSRELPFYARILMKALTPIMSPFMVGHDETGQRQLFHATSGMYPPAKPAAGAALAGGVSLPAGVPVGTGSDGKVGSGGYLVNWNGDITGKLDLISKYRTQGVSKTVWQHTMDTFQNVEKINQERKAAGSL